MNRQILHGDVLEKLAEIESESINVVITSPPYWGLRDYGVDGQLGLEKDFRDYLGKLSDMMVQVRRILKKDGTCWVNLGDTYSTNSKNYVQEKSRIGIPQRFYIDCIDDGWIARNDAVWYKSNSMPASVTDRFSNKFEPVYFFAKNQRYYFNLDEIREEPVIKTKPPKIKHSSLEHSQSSLFESDVVTLGNSKALKSNKQDNVLGADGKPKGNYAGFNERYREQQKRKSVNTPQPNSQQTISLRHSGIYDVETGEPINHPNGKNPGDVFFINPHPFPEAHFATFPVELPKRILRCACPKDGIVLDPFFGSGTTGVAAEELGLRWVGIELSEEYIEIANRRLEKYKNKSLVSFT